MARKQEAIDDALLEQTESLAQKLTEKAVESDGAIDGEELDRLRRLTELVGIRGVKRRRYRWPIAVALAGTMLALSLLFFGRVPETSIELDLAASSVVFELAASHSLAGFPELRAIGLNGLDRPTLPLELDSIADDEAVGALRLALPDDSLPGSSISLSSLFLPKGTLVTVSSVERHEEHRLSLEGSEVLIQIGVLGEIRFDLPGRQGGLVNVRIPRALESAASDQLEIDLDLAEALPATLGQQIPVSSLALARIEESARQHELVARRLSTILGGKLYFESLGGKELHLRPGESLSFDGLTGEIRALSLEAGQLSLALSGQVSGINVGSSNSSRSLMPTYLVWLQARHGLALLWGSALYVFGLLLTVLRWWGVRL